MIDPVQAVEQIVEDAEDWVESLPPLPIDDSAIVATVLPLACIALAALLCGCQIPWMMAAEPLRGTYPSTELVRQDVPEEVSSSIRSPSVSSASITSLSEETP